MEKTEIKKIYDDLQMLISHFANRHGLTEGEVKLCFNKDDFSLKCNFSTHSKPDYIKSLRRNGFKYGLTEQMIGTKIPYKNTTMEFRGMKGCKLVFDVNGVEFVFTPSLFCDKIIFVFKNAKSL